MSNPSHTSFHVAVVGSGPAAFYVAEQLLAAELPLYVDMFERLPEPHGLVRYGVAPDQPKIRRIADRFVAIARSDALRIWPNVGVGEDLSLEELRDHYDAVIVATGASADRKLDIPGAALPGFHSSMEFVGWYNGHPDYDQQGITLQGERAVVIGNGNVALDVARMLARSASELHDLDMPDHAREALSNNTIREVVIVGRRGPAQISFTAQELGLLSTLERANVQVDPDDLELNVASRNELALHENRHRKRAYDVLTAFEGGAGDVTVRLAFLASPVEVLGADHVEGIRLCRNALEGPAGAQQAVPTEKKTELMCGLVISCIGYQQGAGLGLPVHGDHIANEEGRVQGADRVYVVGWARTGPKGLIGGAKADALHVTPAILEDLQARAPGQAKGGEAIAKLLKRCAT